METTYKIDIYKLSDKKAVKEVTYTEKQKYLAFTFEGSDSAFSKSSILTASIGKTSATGDLTIVTDKNNNKKTTVTATLLSIDYCKQIYEPGWVKVVLQIDNGYTDVQIMDSFEDCILDLSVNSEEFANHYYIFQVNPVYKKVSDSTSCTVTLTAYSPDKFLTLDTYSRAYTCKRPFEDILSATLTTFKGKDTFAQFMRLTKQVNNNLKHLISDKGFFLLPYSVQYNESFYDFLVRLANRHGEFLYWDKGKLQMGLASSESTSVSTYAEVTYEKPMFNAGSNATPVRAIATDKELKGETVEDRMLNPSEVANEEYWAPLSKDGYVGFGDLMTAPVIVSELVGVLSEPDLFSIIASAALKVTLLLEKNGAKAGCNKADWEKSYFTLPSTDPEKALEKPKYDDKEKNYSPFSKYVKPEDLVKLVGKNFYQVILKEEQKMDASCMQVKCTGAFYNIDLGGLFTIDSNTDKYVLIQMEGHAGYEEEKKEGETTSSSVFKDSLVLTGIPNNETETNTNNEYPITSPKGWVRKSEPQTAFVVDTKDPLRMGRVRIKYLWQPNVEDETDASPWIRMSTPMASKESGVFFLPSKGDEVLVSFENGNVERPYMTGALHNKRTMPYNGSANQTITSLNGHQIAFRDGSPLGWVNGCGLKFISTLSDMIPPFAQVMKTPGTDGSARIMSGGITLSDPLHFYSISTSTENRSVTISSPLGTISLNALTGIKIFAPNGEITLKGKNITLEAGNKVTIKSGANISTGVGDCFASKAMGWAKLRIKEYMLDLSLFRTLIEALIKPIDGTLRIKSQRYLCLDAGEGTAQVLDHGRFSEHKAKNFGRLFLGMGNKSEDYVKRIRNFDACVQSCLTELAIKSNAIINAREVYHNKWNEWPSKEAFTEANWNTDVNNILQAGRANQPLPELAHADDYFAATQNPPCTRQELNELREKLRQMVTTIGNFRLFVQQQLKSNRLEEGLYDTCNRIAEFSNQVNNFNVLNPQADILHAQIIADIAVPVTLRRKVIKAALPTLLAGSDIAGDNAAVDWDAFINSVRYAQNIQNVPGSKAKKVVAELLGVSGFLDQYTWQQSNKGEILFANKKGETCYLTKDKTIDSYKGSSSVIDDIKACLRTI